MTRLHQQQQLDLGRKDTHDLFKVFHQAVGATERSLDSPCVDADALKQELLVVRYSGIAGMTSITS